MRIGYVLLGLVTLTSVHVSSGQECSNGLAGIQNGDVCCDAGCGGCGGRGCGRLNGGNTNCCTSRIMDSGVMCSTSNAAPCIIDNEMLCSNGVPGVERDGICCEAQCGTCGGSGCARRPGGSSACCSSRIEESGVQCSTTMEAPCIIDDEPVCSNGVPGVERDGICCEAQCGTCGGSGCARRPGGSEACCISSIQNSNVFCSATTGAPCIVAPTPTPPPTTVQPTPTPTTVPPTTVPPTTVPPTTVPPTTVPPTTVPPTTAPPTTVPPTTAPPTTVPPTTVPPTTVPPTTVPPTTVPPTTVPPTTVPPTTVPPTTVPPTTVPPTTGPPTMPSPYNPM